MTKVNLTPKELKSLEEILNYLGDEEESLEEYKSEGGLYQDHIKYHIDKMWKFVKKAEKANGTP